MDKKHSQILLSGICLFMGVVACVVPGQTSPPEPVSNPGAAETFIAGTVQAAANQTEQAGLITSTPTMIALATSTSTPRISLSGTSLQVLADQSTEFVDHQAGIKLIVPAGWMAVRVNEEEYYKAFATGPVLENPEIYNRLNQIQTHDANFFRLDAIDIRPGHVFDGIIADMSVIFQAGDLRTLEEWEQAERSRKSPYSGFKAISTGYRETANGTRVLVIESSWDYPGEKTLYYQGVFFSFPTGTVVLDFQTNLEYKDDVLPDFGQVVDSLTLLAP